MKKTDTFFLLSIWSLLLMLIGNQVNGQISIATHNTSVNTNFNGWNGTMPNGFERSANNNYVGSSESNTGGVYAIPNRGFGYQPSSNVSAMTTMVTGRFINNTGGTITELKVTYDAFKIVHRDARNPCWTVNVSYGVFGTNLEWCSDQPAATKTASSPVSIPNGTEFTITFTSGRGNGSQSSPMIGFNNVKVESIKIACTPPDAPISEPQFFCSTATVNDLFAVGENIKWYDAQDATTALTTDTVLQTGTYYVTQTVNECESEKAAVEISVQPAPEVPLAEAQTFCGSATIADLIAQGNDLKWYDSVNATTPLVAGTQLQTGIYYVSQTANNCESPKTPVEITVNDIPTAPVAEAQAFCGSATVSDLIPSIAPLHTENFSQETESIELPVGQHNFDLSWTVINRNVRHDCATGAGYDGTGCGLRLYNNFDPVKGSIKSPVLEGVHSVSFYAKKYTTQQNHILRVSKIVNGVETVVQDINLTNVTDYTLYNVEINENEDVEVVFTSQSGHVYFDNVKFNEAVTINWYDVATEGTPLSADAELSTGTYYVSKSRKGCESERTPVEITINEIPAAPIAEAQTFCGTATVADLEAEGTDLTWFDAVDANEALTSETELTSGTYYVTQTTNDCTSARTPVEITINEIPTAPVAEAQVFCGIVTIDDLLAEGTNLTWYATQDSTEALTNEIELTSGTYYVAQTANDCTSERTPVEITINEIPVAPVAEAQAFCGMATVADLVAEGTNLSWFDAIDSTEALTEETELTSGTYYVTQSANDCSSERTAVEIKVNEIPAAPAVEAQDFCGTAIVADLVAEGTNLTWYATENSTEALTEETELTSGTYYVAQSLNDCTSERTAVEITINELPENPEAQDQSFCGEATVADLVAGGTNLAWYETQDATEELTSETELTSGTYYVSQSSETCESVRIPIEVTINEIPDAPIAVSVQTFEPGATLADLDVEGENLTWYDEEGNVLDPSTPLVDGEIYYVSQTVNGCESETIGIESQELGINESDFVYFNVYPNPVKNILHISNANQIDNVLVFNLSGQLILEKKVNAKSVELNLSHLASATYVIKVVSNNQIKTVKVIKK